MTKLWNIFKNKFFTKQFMTFVIIGFINTAINSVVVWLCKTLLSSIYEAITNQILTDESVVNTVFRMIAVVIAFIVATIFSYFANSRFAFNNKEYSWRKLVETVGILLIRLVIVLILTEIFAFLLGFTNLSDFVSAGLYDTISNLLASILLIPAAYLVLEKILKVKKDDASETDID